MVKISFGNFSGANKHDECNPKISREMFVHEGNAITLTSDTIRKIRRLLPLLGLDSLACKLTPLQVPIANSSPRLILPLPLGLWGCRSFLIDFVGFPT